MRKPHERPSIGVLLCATKDHEVVEYALSRAVSPALVAEYQTRLPDKKLLQAKLHEFYEMAQAQAARPALEGPQRPPPNRPGHGRGRRHKPLPAAVTGAGSVGGVMNAILEYRYADLGVAAFSPYLARAVTNALHPANMQTKTGRELERRMAALALPEDCKDAVRWVDRSAPAPEAKAIESDLLKVVKRVIPRLPTAQQRMTAKWMIAQILNTGALPVSGDVARIQQPPLSRQRGSQIMKATVENLSQMIEADCPQLAEHGIHGWEDFQRAFDPPQLARQDRPSNAQLGKLRQQKGGGPSRWHPLPAVAVLCYSPHRRSASPMSQGGSLPNGLRHAPR